MEKIELNRKRKNLRAKIRRARTNLERWESEPESLITSGSGLGNGPIIDSCERRITELEAELEILN